MTTVEGHRPGRSRPRHRFRLDTCRDVRYSQSMTTTAAALPPTTSSVDAEHPDCARCSVSGAQHCGGHVGPCSLCATYGPQHLGYCYDPQRQSLGTRVETR